MLNNDFHLLPFCPSFRALIGATVALLVPLGLFAAPNPALQPSTAPIHVVSVDSTLVPAPTAFTIGGTSLAFPGDPPHAATASRRFTVRWYANPQNTLSAVLLLEFASPASPGVIRSRTLRLDPKATGFQSASFDVPFPDAVYWQASILSSGRLLSRLQSPNWYEIRNP